MEAAEAYPEHERPVAAWCDPEMLYVRLADERRIGVPLIWYTFLLNATQSQRADVELQMGGVRWPELDEEISVKSIIAGLNMLGSQESIEVDDGFEILRSSRAIPPEERDQYREGAHQNLDYRSKIHESVHDTYKNSMLVAEFDYDRFFAATDSLFDSSNMLYTAETMEWPANEYVGQLLMFGVLQALTVQRDAALQLLKCFGREQFFSLEDVFRDVNELRVAVAGHPSDHRRTRVKGCTFLGHRSFGSRTKFTVVTYENFTKWTQRELDLIEMIVRQQLAVQANFAKVWAKIRDTGTFSANLFSEKKP